jgi:hypothetical protein
MLAVGALATTSEQKVLTRKIFSLTNNIRTMDLNPPTDRKDYEAHENKRKELERKRDQAVVELAEINDKLASGKASVDY